MCQYSGDRYVRSNAPIPDEAPSGARGADAQAHHGDRRRAPRAARSRTDHDQRDRRARRGAALDGLPALPRRGLAVRRVLCRTGAPRTRRPTRAAGPRSRILAKRTEAALRDLYAFYARTEAMYTSLLRDEPLVPPIERRLRDFYGYLRAIEDILMAGRGLRGRAARRTRAAHRPRARLPHLALAGPRAGARRRRRRRPDACAGGGCRRGAVRGRGTSRLGARALVHALDPGR